MLELKYINKIENDAYIKESHSKFMTYKNHYQQCEAQLLDSYVL